MDSNYWRKRANNSTTSHGIYLKSKYHRQLQTNTRQHSHQRQEYFENKYSIKYIHLKPNYTHSINTKHADCPSNESSITI